MYEHWFDNDNFNLFLRSMREMQKQNKATTGHVHALIYILNVGVYHIEP